ncbi:hypothetical protein MMC30_001001, partial [Trapelia coarctata]|nr:hypothetical protein [Trapelia coarctata]
MSDPAHPQTSRSSYSSASNASASSFSQLNGEPSSSSSRVPATSPEQKNANHQRSHSGPVGTAGGYKAVGDGENNEDTVRRSHRPRHSGGFLLDSTPAAAFGSGPKRHTMYGTDSKKGKNKQKETDIGLRSLRDRHPGHRHNKPSIGSSPLATVVTNFASPENDGLDGSSSTPSNPVAGSRPSADRSPRDSLHSDRGSFDTDPAQIVNLALNLSESRRRQASIGRLSPIDALGNNRRIVSAGQLGPGITLTPMIGLPGGSLRYQLQQQRKGVRNLSPRSDLFDRPEVTPTYGRLNQEPEPNNEPPIVPWYDLQLLDDLSFNPSDATLLRAEKAKTALELSYEYRRLLQHLPRLPGPPKSRPSTARGGVKPAQEVSRPLGRAYNPLQYVRNRKVRGRERKEFDAEADGWKDVDKVRDWVNTVASQPKDHVTKADEKYFLPPFAPVAQAENVADDPSMLSPHRANAPSITKITKPPRPRSDWVSTPWDLLADAYWLELDEHKKLIEDRDGHKILPVVKPQTDPDPRSSREIPRILPRRSASIPRTGHSPERPKLAGDTPDASSKERGRRRHQLRDSITSLREYNSSQDRKGKWHRKLIRSQSSSSSDESVQGSVDRNSRLRGRGDSRERQDSAVLERQVMELLAKEAENVNWGSQEAVTSHDPDAELSLEDPLQFQKSNGNSVQPKSTRSNSKERKRQSRDLSPRKRDSGNEIEDKPRISFDDLDLTAPNSPINKEVVPSIAINLSPPGSRPGSPRKPMPSQHRPHGLERSKGRGDVDETDFAAVSYNAPTKIGSRLHANRSSSGHNSAEYHDEVLLSPNDSLLSPKTAEATGRSPRRRRSDSRSLKGFRDESESKIRGLLKGSRLADMVGKPVSRVGDLLFRKDGSNRPSNVHSPTSSYVSEASETDEDPSDDRDTEQKRSSTELGELRMLPNTSSNGRPPKYHMNNLPSFRSPDKKNHREKIDASTLSEDDHIARQQLEFRGRGRPSRFDRLAPPSLDMRSVSPSPSPSLRRLQTREADISDESRRPSATSDIIARRSLQPALLGLPGKLRQDGPPPTGLASLDTKRRGSSTHPESERNWSISNCDISAIRGAVSQRDITRVRAFLLSSGVKANEITRRANEIPATPSTLLQEAQSITGLAISPVPRCQEHQLAARLLVKFIDSKHVQLSQALDQLSHGPIDSSHEQLKSVDTRISTALTPRVRASADDADALSLELSTSYRLDVKQLNDSIDHILRRKRRRFRWVRRGGYLLLEWMLLGAMWWVWLIVVVVRLVMGFVG